MKIGYLNFLINNIANLKRTKQVDLKELYKQTFENKTLPIVKGWMTFEKVEICATSRGCTPKRDGVRHNDLTIVKSEKGQYGKHTQDEKKYAMMNIRGTVNINGVDQKFHIRVPKSTVIRVTVGMSQQEVIKDDKQVQEFIEALTNGIMHLLQPSVKYLAKPQIVGMTLHGYNLFNPETQNYPQFKILNYMAVMTMFVKNIDGFRLKYDIRNGKTFNKAVLKGPEGSPTVGVSSWGVVDFSGLRNLNDAYRLLPYLTKAFEKVKPSIKFDESSVRPVKKIINLSSIPKLRVIYKPPKYDVKLKKYVYEDKEFGCEKLKKEEIRAIAEVLGVSVEGTKKELCSFIMKVLGKNKNAKNTMAKFFKKFKTLKK
jgi:hypothetical protein